MELKHTIKDIAKNSSLDPFYKEMMKIIAGRAKVGQVGDALGDSFKAHSIDEVNTLKNIQQTMVENNLVSNGGFRSLREVRDSSVIDVAKLAKQFKVGQVGDSYSNPIYGMGTGVDPTMYSNATLPINISPYEGASLYANGGLPQVIIQKKAKGLLLNGFEFEGCSMEESKQLKDRAIKLGFDRAIPTQDALVYGGAGMYPVYKKESSKLGTYTDSVEALIRKGVIGKDSIDRFVSADRWNIVIIPNYTITAKDYLNPSSIYLPLGAIRVNTERCALIRPIKLPFWAAMTHLGWSTSDYTGYIKDIYDYRITMMTLPLLFQQMSLLFQLLPLDAVLMVSGIDRAKDIAKYNAQEMREANILNPKALNAIGDIKVIDRTFTGAEPLIRAMRQNLCANAYMQESVIFDPEQSGFTDKTNSIKLKQSEAIKMIGTEIAPQLQKIVELLIIDVFGADSKLLKDNVRVTFNPSVVISEEEKAEKGLKCAQFIKTLTDSNLSPVTAVSLAKQYFNMEIGKEDMAEIERRAKLAEDNEKAVKDQVSSSRFAGGRASNEETK